MSAKISYLLCTFLLAAAALADDVPEELKQAKKILAECAETHKVSVESFEDFKKIVQDPPENVLCFMKCLSEKDGTLDVNGKFNIKTIDEFLEFIKVKNENTKKVTDCLAGLDPIKTCTDMKKVAKCIPKIN